IPFTAPPSRGFGHAPAPPPGPAWLDECGAARPCLTRLGKEAVPMSAYVIVDIDVRDPDLYEHHKRAVPPSIDAFGGRYLARGGRTEVLEGEWTPKRLVILEFEDAERAKAWLNSREYAEARAMRQRATRTNMVVIEGVS